MAKKDRERYKKEMVARDEEALKEQEARRSAKDDIIERARPKYISKKMIDARKRAAENKKDPKAEEARLAQLEADVASGKVQVENIDSKADRRALIVRKERRARMVLQREHEQQMEEQMKVLRQKRAARLRYLLQQSDVFSHFMNKGAASTSAAAKSPSALPSSPSKRHHGGDGEAVLSKRKTEDEEDAILLQQAQAEGALNVRLSAQPKCIANGTMRDYQLEGLNWMIGLNTNGMNGILADEMGLGKTLQSISVLGYMSEFRGVDGPHIVVVPKSTMPNWMNEFKRWCPKLRTIKLHGNKASRKETIEAHLKAGVREADRKWDVVVTSYEMCILECNTLKKLPWKYLILDEAHRVKNENSRLSKVLRQFSVQYRVLLTGTPLQNNLHELWALLNFLLPEIFHSSEDFDEWFDLAGTDDDDAKRKLVGQLHKILKPFMLRRLKADVAKCIPPKTELLLYTGLSKMQQQLYKKTLMREMSTLQGTESGSKSKLCNIVMQLRKACNHPYLFNGAEDRSLDPMGDHLITNCGKLCLLDKLLPKLKEQGSRVLIFSQMTRLLDILEDYSVIRGHKYCRIDGQTDYERRAQQIDAYNAPESEYFMFLLSTRAGGLGINLATADTVIIYDSDWNPQVDLQAQDRAHRIGQTKPVHVYRLVTENTIEEKIIERAEMKLRLDAVIVQQGRIQAAKASASKNEMVAAIRYGADKVFRANEGTVTDHDIDAIIARGKEKTKELTDALEEKTKGDALDFKLEYSTSIQEFDGVDYADLRQREEERKRQEALAFTLSMSSAIGKRERSKATTYNVDHYYREIDKGYHQDEEERPKLVKQPRIRIPKPRRLPRMDDWHFYNKERLQELADVEEKRFEVLFNTPPSEIDTSQGPLKLLTEEQEVERNKLLSEGFKDWNAGCFRKFVSLMNVLGRKDFKQISSKLNARGYNKSEEEVRVYSEAFWRLGAEKLPDFPKYEANIKKGEAKLEEMLKLMEVVTKKVASTRLGGPFEVDRMKFLDKARLKWTRQEDAFLLCALTDIGYGRWPEIKFAIQKHERFRFDYYFQSRSHRDLKARCDLLIRNVVKEEKEIEKKAAKEREVEEKRRVREEAQIQKMLHRQQLADKRLQEKEEARRLRVADKAERKKARAEKRVRERSERRSRNSAERAAKRAAAREARKAARLMTAREKQIAATVIDEGRDGTMSELVNAIAAKLPPPGKTKTVIVDLVRRLAVKRRSKKPEDKAVKTKKWFLVERALLLKTEEWVKRWEARGKDAAFIAVKDGPVPEDKYPLLLRLVQVYGAKSMDDLIEVVQEHILHVSASQCKAKIKEMALKDKRLGQKKKRWNINPQFFPVLNNAPKRDDLDAIKQACEEYMVDYDEAEADADNDDDSSSSDSDSSDDSDGEYEFIQKNGPKRPPTAFNTFCTQERAKLSSARPELKGRELTKELGAIWKDLPAEAKAPILKIVAGTKKKYEQEYKIFENGPLKKWRKEHPDSSDDESSDDSSDEEEKRRPKKKKKPNPLQQFEKAHRPKKPKSPYLLFSLVYRKELVAARPEIKKGKDVMVLIGAKWKSMDAASKEKYKKEAGVLKAQYAKEMQAYEKKLAEFKENNPALLVVPESSEDSSSEDSSSSDEEQTRRKRKKLNPVDKFIKMNGPKRPMSAYLLFVAHFRKQVGLENPEMSQKDIMRRMGQLWKKTSMEERKPFNDQAAALKAAHPAKLQAFKDGPLAEFIKKEKEAEQEV